VNARRQHEAELKRKAQSQNVGGKKKGDVKRSKKLAKFF